MKPATGTAHLELVITTMRKKGKKMVPLRVVYVVRNANPDPRVAHPAYSLTKEDGTVYHCSHAEFGARCDCFDGEKREKLGTGGGCKHARALQAVGLLPK